MNYIIRKKERKDCAGIAHVVTIAWNETYRGIVPDEFLDNLYNNEEERANKSFKSFDKNDNHQYVLEVDNKVVGFINVGIDELKNMGYNKMVIGCLVGNSSNDFYKHIGGKYIKQRLFERLQLPENVYYFENI